MTVPELEREYSTWMKDKMVYNEYPSWAKFVVEVVIPRERQDAYFEGQVYAGHCPD